MNKLLLNFEDYKNNTGYTEEDFYTRYIKPIEEGIQQQNKNNKSRTNKQKIPYDFKWSVWERDNFTCRHCGSRGNLSVDHIIPESKGGQLTMENCQTLCCKCNSKKGTR